jgi:proteasome lid subunit RPN8/RPN11
MAIQLSKEQMDEIFSHAREDYPYECCGVMLGSASADQKRTTRVRRLENVHEEGHERRFLISAQSMFEVERDARQSGDAVLGFYHSHPDHPARPSQYDRDWAWPWYSYIIVSVMGGSPGDVTSWTFEEDDAPFQPEEIIIEREEKS